MEELVDVAGGGAVAAAAAPFPCVVAAAGAGGAEGAEALATPAVGAFACCELAGRPPQRPAGVRLWALPTGRVGDLIDPRLGDVTLGLIVAVDPRALDDRGD